MYQRILKYAPVMPVVQDKTKLRILAGAIILGGLYYGKKLYTTYQKKNSDRLVAESPEKAQALLLRSALSPTWLWYLSEADKNKLFEVAEQINDYKAVSTEYGNETEGRSLEDDLKFKLSAEGLSKFLALASKGKTGDKKYAKVRTDIPAKQWVITIAEANIRKTPVLQSKWLPANNIVATVPANKSIGVSTGKFAYDENGDVTFIEFSTFNSKRQKVFYYVAKSQVAYKSGPEMEKLDKTRDKIPFVLLNGVSDNQQNQLVSLRPCIIYDENKNALFTSAANLILGFPVMEINTGNETLIQFKTIQDKIRWVNKAYTKTVAR